MSSEEKFSTKLYAVVLEPKIKYVTDDRTIFLTDVSMAIAHSPTLSSVTGLSAQQIFQKIKYSGGSSYSGYYSIPKKRIIEYPGTDRLSVSEIVTKYRYESVIPEWLGGGIGFVFAFAIIQYGESAGFFVYFPSWAVWPLVFLPIGFAWDHILGDKKYYLSEIIISGDKDLVLKTIKEIRNNLGRHPLLVLRNNDLKKLAAATDMDPISLEESWDKALYGKI